MHDKMREMRLYQMKNALLRPKNERGMWRGWMWGVWEREKSESIERDQWEMKEITLALYIEKYKARWNERYREVSSFKFLPNGVIERCPQQSGLNGLRNYRAFIEHTETSSMDREAVKKLLRQVLKILWWIKIAITAVEKRRSRGSIDSLAVERCREAVEIAQK